MSLLGEKILAQFSKTATETSHSHTEDLSQARASLQQLIPDLDKTVQNSLIVDFGSGEGWHALALGQAGARKVIGLDIEAPKIERSRARAGDLGLADRVIFDTAVPAECMGACDAILSRDSMEHYQDPEGIMRRMKECLRPGGRLWISFGPPWYAPYGAHMNYFLPIPWVHLFFSEASIMAVRTRFRKDGARRYEEVPGGLNRMSVARFEKIVKECGLKVIHLNPHFLRGHTWLKAFPLGRELFITSIACVLERTS